MRRPLTHTRPPLVAALVGLLLVAVVIARPGRAAAETVPVHRVFVYVMENTNYADVVGNPDAPYLNGLIDDYALATNYTATGHASLDNYIAMTSGQLPNPATSADCFVYFSVVCIQDVPNIADQMEAAGYDWKGYMDAMPGPCVHTEENTPETAQVGYSARHNPFLYYRSIVDDQERCDAHDVPLTELWEDMAAGTVPEYAFITPDTCHDGHDSGDGCEMGGGVAEADWFASITIPRILADPSWQDGGLIFVTFDESGIADDDSPFSFDSGTPDFGGRIYTVLVSPNVDPGTTLDDPYDHFSMLKTVEDIFCLDHLAGAGGAGVRSMIGAIHQERCADLTAAGAEPTPAESPSAAAVDPSATAVGGDADAQPGLPVTGGGAALVGVATLAVGGVLSRRRGGAARS